MRWDWSLFIPLAPVYLPPGCGGVVAETGWERDTELQGCWEL